MRFENLLLSLSVLVACVSPLSASVTVDSPLNGQPTTTFPAVGQFGTAGNYTGSATVVFGGQYIITARHLVTSGGGITGDLRPVADLRFQLDGIEYTASTAYADLTADLSLVRLTNACPVSAILYSGNVDTELNQVFTAAGFGQTDSDGNGHWGPDGMGVNRSFQNHIDSIMTGTLAGQGNIFRYDFDKTTGDSVGPDEGIHGPGDSGGGLFMWNNNQWQLAGVLSSSGDPVNGASGSAVQLSAYLPQLLAVVPEPSITYLLFLTAPLIIRRRKPL